MYVTESMHFAGVVFASRMVIYFCFWLALSLFIFILMYLVKKNRGLELPMRVGLFAATFIALITSVPGIVSRAPPGIVYLF